MQRETALTRLRRFEPDLRRQGVSALYLFGSTARDEAREDSDLDLLFDVPAATRFSLFDQARIQNALTSALHTKVDFLPLEGLRPRQQQRIEAELVRVF